MNHLCGYVYSESAIEKFLSESPMVVGDPAPPASGKGKDYFLFDIEQQLTGAVRPPHHQTIGSCVAQGSTGAMEDLQFVQMLRQPGFQFQWLSTEVMYSLARIQVGQGGCGYGDGAVVSWAFEAGQKYGLVARGVYGQYDLTQYSAALEKKWGTPRVGCPQELVEIAKQHLVLKCSLLQGGSLYEQARDVIFNGGAVVSGSNQLFAAQLDKQGFYRASGHGGHCTYWRGFTESGGRPGLGYQNSWGTDPRVTPPGQTVTLGSGRQLVMPAGFGFVDAAEFDSMHRGGGNEVWAVWSESGWLTPDNQVQFQFS